MGQGPGIVGMAEVVVPNSVATPNRLSAGTPAFWSFVWVGLAVIFLMFVNTAMLGRGGR
jgi:hypothetical protein